MGNKRGRSTGRPAPKKGMVAQKLADMLVEDKAIEEAAAYLAAGRQYRSLPIGEIEQRWLAMMTDYMMNKSEFALRTAKNLRAEIRLRGGVLPYGDLAQNILKLTPPDQGKPD